ncbi:energy transducer TonB [Gaetbulibacter sp. M235]|uniref:energy transducer TonB family protein n=1 Tax=Gaetbulibacter sp. M235 TaxID=3126510 RepID=UPI00374F85E7
MNLTNQHKALLITFFLSGTVVMSVFNLSLNQHNELASESYYEVEPEKELTEEEVKILEALEKLNNTKAETNKAFNETAKEKSFAEAYKPIAPPEDYVKPDFNQNQDLSEESSSNNNDISDLNHEEISSFSKVNSILNNRTKKKDAPESSNRKSTIRYSLVDRTDEFLPIPIYLCEEGGTIVINITVNEQGKVIDTYVNSSSTSTNECLIESALEYAKQAKFNASPGKKSQLGSITFNFVGKY